MMQWLQSSKNYGDFVEDNNRTKNLQEILGDILIDFGLDFLSFDFFVLDFVFLSFPSSIFSSFSNQKRKQKVESVVQ